LPTSDQVGFYCIGSGLDQVLVSVSWIGLGEEKLTDVHLWG